MTAGFESARAIAAAVRSGQRAAGAIVEQRLARIAAHDPGLHAFVEVFADRARAAADRIDRTVRAGQDPGPLAGVPVALKDNLLLTGRIAACGSRMLQDFVAPCTATAVARLEAQGAVLLGRTNMDEFGMGSSTEFSAFGPTRNPWDPACVPGGSSGGSAVAVAADFCPLALGSDTGGSVRQPAALCGITGLKPTYGRISRLGLVAYASSLDCVGVLGRDCADLALGLGIAGPDDGDATCTRRPNEDWVAHVGTAGDLRGLRVGVVRALADTGDAAIDGAVGAALQVLTERGARIVEVELPRLEHAVATYYLIAAAEASSNLARYDGVRFGHRAEGARRLDELYERSRSESLGREVQLRILLGTFALQHGYRDQVYGQATRMRARLTADFAAAFAHCDAIATATSPVPAFPLGSRLADPLALYRCDALTVPASLAGLPALSLPCGFANARLPIGLQFTAPHWSEGLLLRLGAEYQRHTDWHQRRPLP